MMTLNSRAFFIIHANVSYELHNQPFKFFFKKIIIDIFIGILTF